jgi:REP element-mobilizing transposase RayT
MSYAHLRIHFVFSTKNREKLIQDSFENELFQYIGGILRKRKHVLLAAGGTKDHIHLLAGMHQSQSIADCVRDIKTNSSVWIHKNQKGLLGFAWQTKYGAFSVSQSSVASVSEYINNQKEHHKTMSYRDEFLALLKKHGLNHDPKYVFE